MTQGQPADRRLHPRVHPTRVSLCIREGERRNFPIIEDLSVGGVRLFVDHKLAAGAVLDLEMRVKDGSAPFAFRGCVLRAHGEGAAHVAIRFLEMNAETKERLSGFVASQLQQPRVDVTPPPGSWSSDTKLAATTGATDLFDYGRRWLIDPRALRKSLKSPLLVWSNADPSKALSSDLTQHGSPLTAPRVAGTRIFELKKGARASNALAMGITVGRASNNDVVLDGPTISRFHAYFHQDERTGTWQLVDAGSSNGTWVEAKKLEAESPENLATKTVVRFGHVRLSFFEPNAFMNYLEGVVTTSVGS